MLVCTLFTLSGIEYYEMRVISYFMLASQVLFGEEFRLEKDKIAIDNAVVYWTDDKVQEMVSLEKDSNIGFLFGETSNGGKEKEKEKEVPKRDDETNQNAVAYLNPVSLCTCWLSIGYILIFLTSFHMFKILLLVNIDIVYMALVHMLLVIWCNLAFM